MKKQLAILIVKKSDAYLNTVVKALEASGFTVVQQVRQKVRIDDETSN